MAAAKVRIVSKTVLTPAARMCCELHQRTHAGTSELASACFVCVLLPCTVCGWWNEFSSLAAPLPAGDLDWSRTQIHLVLGSRLSPDLLAATGGVGTVLLRC